LKHFSLSFDVEEFDLPLEMGKKISEEEMFDISFKGTKKILRLLDNKRLKATFFVTANFAKKYPSLVKEMGERHEIALHGYKHSTDYGQLSYDETLEDLSKAKKEIEKIISCKVYGFRSPRMANVPFEILKEIGLEYDSSLHPTYIPGRYNDFFKPRKPFVKNDILIIPVSVTPLIRAPIAWLWLRNLGLGYAKVCTNFCFMTDDYLNTYFHPWEFVSLKDFDIPLLIKRNTGIKIYKDLNEYIRWLLKKNVRFLTFKEVFDDYSSG